jgi:ABC-type amino acid transport system permease subunit
VPLISVLFMASFMFPLFMPIGKSPDVLVRVIVGITLFAAAYMAEIVRGGLQTLGKGQVEAAASLGLGYWQTQIKIVLPQALGAVVPSIMNNFISLFKDTSLVTIVSAVRADRCAVAGGRLGPELAALQDRSLYLHRRNLLHLLLRHVALQPVDRTPLARAKPVEQEQEHE